VPPHAAAQGDQPQEVRASKFTLVAPDGTVIGTWESEASQQVTRGGVTATPLGGGRLTISNSTGKPRLRLNPNGLFVAYEEDGSTPRFAAGYLSPPIPGPTGNPPVNGLQLDSQASIDYVLGSPKACGQPSIGRPNSSFGSRSAVPRPGWCWGQL
jgi:hypothetical protein